MHHGNVLGLAGTGEGINKITIGSPVNHEDFVDTAVRQVPDYKVSDFHSIPPTLLSLELLQEMPRPRVILTAKVPRQRDDLLDTSCHVLVFPAHRSTDEIFVSLSKAPARRHSSVFFLQKSVRKRNVICP